MDNVINFRKIDEPIDLLSFKELGIKYGFKYSYLYKWACLEGELTVYPRGIIKLSESEVLEFSRNRGAKYGRDKKKDLQK